MDKNCVKLGCWLSSGGETLDEILGLFPFGWLLLDGEHGAFAMDSIVRQLRALSRSSAEKIVRVPNCTNDAICSVLDWGADGIMLPHADNAPKVRACVEAMRYPPYGVRSCNASARDYDYGLARPENFSSVKKLLLAQIESVEGVSNCEEIAETDGVDVLFVGPCDLGLSLKADPRFGFDEAVNRVAKAARNAGKKCGILAGNFDDAKKYAKLGFEYIAATSDIRLVRGACSDFFSRYGSLTQS